MLQRLDSVRAGCTGEVHSLGADSHAGGDWGSRFSSADTKVPHLGLRWGIALSAYFSVGVSIARPFESTFFLSSTLSTAYM